MRNTEVAVLLIGLVQQAAEKVRQGLAAKTFHHNIVLVSCAHAGALSGNERLRGPRFGKTGTKVPVVPCEPFIFNRWLYQTGTFVPVRGGMRRRLEALKGTVQFLTHHGYWLQAAAVLR